MDDATNLKGIGTRFFWGWYVVLGAFLILAINYGARYSFGVFVKPMAEQHHWSRSVISAGMSVMVLAYGIGGIFAGRLADRIAPRWIITAGAVLMAAGLFLTALIREPWHFYITYGVFGGFGAACLGVVVCNSSVGKWFVRKRGLAIGIASIGVGAGTMATVPLAGYVVKVYGWQMGFAAIGVFVLIIGVGLSQWLMGRTKPEDYRLEPDGGSAGTNGLASDPEPFAVSSAPSLAGAGSQELPVLDHGGLLQSCRDGGDVGHGPSRRLCPGPADRQGCRGILPGDDRHGQHLWTVFLRVDVRSDQRCKVCSGARIFPNGRRDAGADQHDDRHHAVRLFPSVRVWIRLDDGADALPPGRPLRTPHPGCYVRRAGLFRHGDRGLDRSDDHRVHLRYDRLPTTRPGSCTWRFW